MSEMLYAYALVGNIVIGNAVVENMAFGKKEKVAVPKELAVP